MFPLCMMYGDALHKYNKYSSSTTFSNEASKSVRYKVPEVHPLARTVKHEI